MSEQNIKSRKALFEILIILSILISVFTVYGLAEKPFEFSFPIEQADVKSLFRKDSLPEKAQDSAEVTISEKEEKEKEDAPVDSTSKFILFCGDSMTEQMRFAWEEYAKKNGHKIITCTWYSSTTEIWSKTDRLATLIKEYKPDIIWFTLGANELFTRDIDKREAYIKDIIKEADTTNTPFVWIGPPNWKDDSGINAAIEKYLGKKRFYYSGHFRQRLARGSDGAHPTKAAAAVWADSIAVWYKTESAYKKNMILFSPKDSVEAKPYAPLKEICAPARDGKFKVRILKAEHQPILCEAEKTEEEKKKVVEVKLNTGSVQDTVNQTRAVQDSQKIDLPKTSSDSNFINK